MSRNKSRGAYVRPDDRQKEVPNTGSANLAELENSSLSTHPQQEDIPSIEDDFEQSFDAAMGADLDSMFEGSEFTLEDAPTLEDLSLDGNSVVEMFFKGQPNNLQTPEPRQGYVQYLFCTVRNGKVDHQEISKAKNMGYVPRRASTLSAAEKRKYRTESFGSGGDGVIRVGEGYILYECRKEVAEIRKRQTLALTERQTVSADPQYRGQAGYVKVDDYDVRDGFEQVGGGRRVSVAPNRGMNA